ncbi:MAG TPA: hypothetical protein DSN98_08520 [Thermoplasmata archaeon]|jgi:hypothetical protein|nr:MAG TPA: hypothetical protein DSN98_08520 [Thermoplasmata archaeon]
MHLNNALSMLCKEYEGMKIERSHDGKIIQVRYAKLDDPVKSYHPEGNLRLSKTNDGEWKISGDAWNCRELYKEVTDAILVNYQQSGVDMWLLDNNYTTESETETKEGNKILIARKW